MNKTVHWIPLIIFVIGICAGYFIGVYEIYPDDPFYFLVEKGIKSEVSIYTFLVSVTGLATQTVILIATQIKVPEDL